MARKLDLSMRTVQTHLRNTFNKPDTISRSKVLAGLKSRLLNLENLVNS
ncbi:hypothetical protein ACFLWB_02705 [Chloroflexota bacterium]